MAEHSYRQWREEILRKFDEKTLVDGSVRIHPSPSGRYRLDISEYSSGPVSWNYSRGVIAEADSGRLIADIKRNYAFFWFCWVVQDGREFLLCGEDYQAYNVIDPAAGTNRLTFPPDAFEGRGFCWAAVYPSPDGKTIAVEGCYWACPYELVFFDFSDPVASPLPELFRVEDFGEAKGWIDENRFLYTLDEKDAEPQTWARLPDDVPL